MRKNFGKKPYIFPLPVFILAAYDKNGIASAMNAAWGGLSDTSEISLCISPGHKTMKNILETKAFTVSMGTSNQVIACDYVGIVSANKVPDKVEQAGWHTVKSEFVNAPLIEELPMALECKFLNYDTNSCRLVGEIVNVNADEQILDENGKIDVQKLDPITYDPIHNKYLKLGDAVGSAFGEGKKLKGELRKE